MLEIAPLLFDIEGVVKAKEAKTGKKKNKKKKNKQHAKSGEESK